MRKNILFMKYCYKLIFPVSHIIILCSLKVDLLNYKPSREWNLLSATARKHLEDYGSNITFPWIEYSFVLQRHSSLYEATLGVSALGKKCIAHVKVGLLEHIDIC
jgi:hypothetical protein